MAESIYRALYVCIFLHFARMVCAKLSIIDGDIYGVYVPGCNRHGIDFNVRIALSRDIGLLHKIRSKLDNDGWFVVIAADGSGFKEQKGATFSIHDPTVKELLGAKHTAELMSALEGIPASKLIERV